MHRRFLAISRSAAVRSLAVPAKESHAISRQRYHPPSGTEKNPRNWMKISLVRILELVLPVRTKEWKSMGKRYRI